MDAQTSSQVQENATSKGHYHYLSLKRDPTEREFAAMRRYVRGDRSARGDIAGIIQVEQEVDNLVPTVGRTVLARRLSGDTTYTGEINYGALGSGTTPFTNASTQLNTEVFRKIKSDSSFDNNITYTDWFIASGDVADQTFQEFSAVIDGTGTANSGQAFSLVVTGGWVKSGSCFISLRVTFS